jgi:hypothetical protein
MNAISPTLVPLFATPFGVVPLPDAAARNVALTGLLAARAAADTDPARTANPLCYKSRDDLLDWAEPTVQSVAADMLRGVYTIVAAVNTLSEAQLRSFVPQARAWFTIIRPDGAVPATSYPLTSWCAIYCVGAPPASTSRRDSGVLRLYESRLGTMFADATNSVMRLPYLLGHHGWVPVPGQLAVFPASMTHEIGLIRAPGELVLVTMRVRFVAPGQSGWSTW